MMAGATKEKDKVPVSERALIQRINRKLKQDGEQLRRAKGSQAASTVGDYYVLDTKRNFVASSRVDPEHLGRKLGVLNPWEILSRA
jgi:hypothetical protein